MCLERESAIEIKGFQADRKVCPEGFELKIKTLYFKLTPLRRKLFTEDRNDEQLCLDHVLAYQVSTGGHVHCFTTCTSSIGVFFLLCLWWSGDER